MTELEATRIKLKCMEMVEGTKLKWWECLEYQGYLLSGEPKCLSEDKKTYTIALGIIEGRPVWAGDEYYAHNGCRVVALVELPRAKEYWACCTWLPPKTAMVELLIVDIEYFSTPTATSYDMIVNAAYRLQEACRKTLEQLK